MITIEKIEDRDGRVLFEDKETGSRYARIIGGLGWPGIKPAFVVVVGEDFIEDPSLKVRHLRVFSEFEEENLERFFRKCLQVRGRYQIEDFYGNPENKPMMEFLRDFNRRLEDGIYQLSLGLAPFPVDVTYHAQIIKERLAQGESSLHLPENSLLKGYLLEFGEEQYKKADILDYPAIAALGYVLSHIKNSPFVMPRPHWRERRQTDWRTI